MVFKACDFATALNSYSSAFTATCSDDTVHVCTSTMTEAHNGDTFNLGSSHNSFITVTATTFSGGDNDSTTYTMNLTQDEHHIYGSSRLGVSKHAAATKQVDFGAQVQREKGSDKIFLALLDGIFINQGVDEPVNEDQSAQTFDDLVISLNGSAESIPGVLLTETLGEKRYEFTNHLGNVLLTTSDRRLYVDGNTDGILDYYVADDLSYSDYYPYGMPMVGRNTNLSDYRFGYQGSEMDNEHKGNGNSYTTYFRQHDPRLGRWFSIDPVVQSWQSSYTSMDCNPILLDDPRGDKVISETKSGTTKSTFGVKTFTNKHGNKAGDTWVKIGGGGIKIPKGFGGGQGKLGGTLKKIKKAESSGVPLKIAAQIADVEPSGDNEVDQSPQPPGGPVVDAVVIGSKNGFDTALESIKSEIKKDILERTDNDHESTFKKMNNELRKMGYITYDNGNMMFFQFDRFHSRKVDGSDQDNPIPEGSGVINPNVKKRNKPLVQGTQYRNPQEESSNPTNPILTKDAGAIRASVSYPSGMTLQFFIVIDQVAPPM